MIEDTMWTSNIVLAEIVRRPPGDHPGPLNQGPSGYMLWNNKENHWFRYLNNLAKKRELYLMGRRCIQENSHGFKQRRVVLHYS